MNEYWENRYQQEEKIWGDAPSATVPAALSFFRKNGTRRLLVPGSGYGRNTRYFSAAGLDVTGIEISKTACSIARTFDPSTRFINASVLDMSFDTQTYDAIYCFNVLHLFRHQERSLFIRQCLHKVKDEGVLYFTVFSEMEESCGKGKEIEPDTFESKPSRPVHYFTEEDLKRQFETCRLVETGLCRDEENHGEGFHTHILRYIVSRKQSVYQLRPI